MDPSAEVRPEGPSVETLDAKAVSARLTGAAAAAGPPHLLTFLNVNFDSN